MRRRWKGKLGDKKDKKQEPRGSGGEQRSEDGTSPWIRYTVSSLAQGGARRV